MRDPKSERSAASLRMLALALLGLACVCWTGCSDSLPDDPGKTVLTREQKWSEDIALFATELPRRHANLFFKLSREEFARSVEAVKDSITRLDDAGLMLSLASLVAKIGDAHTTITPTQTTGLHVFPMDLYWFSDGLFVTATTTEYRHLLGKRLMSVGGNDVTEVYTRVKEYIPHENEAWAKQMSPQALILAELLRRLGVIPGTENATISVEGGGTVNVASVPMGTKLTVVSLTAELTGQLPLNLRNSAANYWFSYLDTARAVYCQYNRCREMTTQSFADFNGGLFRFIDSVRAQRFILDLRGNEGGSSPIARPLIDRLKANTTLNRKGGIFVLIGRETFSSAVLNSCELRSETESILVGESTGGNPNGYGEVLSFLLPHSGLRVQYSTKYFHFASGDAVSVVPDIPVTLSSDDFIHGRDPVLDAALAHQ